MNTWFIPEWREGCEDGSNSARWENSMKSVPVVTLKNGLRVANFSSPHPFTFDDGTVLPACSTERARSLMLEADELSTSQEKWTDIELSFVMSTTVGLAIDELQDDPDIDIILVPLPVMEALKNDGGGIGKCRVCRMADRITKVVCSDKFCI